MLLEDEETISQNKKFTKLQILGLLQMICKSINCVHIAALLTINIFVQLARKFDSWVYLARIIILKGQCQIQEMVSNRSTSNSIVESSKDTLKFSLFSNDFFVPHEVDMKTHQVHFVAQRCLAFDFIGRYILSFYLRQAEKRNAGFCLDLIYICLNPFVCILFFSPI